MEHGRRKAGARGAGWTDGWDGIHSRDNTSARRPIEKKKQRGKQGMDKKVAKDEVGERDGESEMERDGEKEKK